MAYRNTEVMIKRTAGKIVGVVELVRWEQFTQQFSVYISECSQVIGKARSES